jgi:hypothetical protein
MRLIVLVSVMLLTLGGSRQPVSAETPTPLPTKLDHILLWGRSIDEVTAILAVKLGFQIRPGHDADGVAIREPMVFTMRQPPAIVPTAMAA